MRHWNSEGGCVAFVFYIKLRFEVILSTFTNWFLQLPENSSYNTRNSDHIETYYCKTDIFKYSFFPYVIVEWNRLDSPTNLHNPLGLKLQTSLTVGLSHLNEHRFNQNFENFRNPLYSCSLEVESTPYFFLHCYNFVNIKNNLLNKLYSINCDISNCSDSSLTELILYGNPKFSFQQNSDIINALIKYMINQINQNMIIKILMFTFVIKRCIIKR